MEFNGISAWITGFTVGFLIRRSAYFRKMKIFLSYSSKDRTQVEPIYLALLAQRHKVFFDRSNLPKGDEYDSHIRKSIEDSNLFIFMVSLNSLNDGSYTLTELGIAQKTWSHPKGKVLPVLISDTQLMKLPAYLKAVTILESNGNLAAEVADAVYRINKEKRRRLLNYFVGGLVLSMMVGAGIYFFLPDVIVKTSTEINGKDGMLGLQIPAGKFLMGDDEWSPKREIYVDNYYMDKYEVSFLMYDRFLQATGSKEKPEYWGEVDLATLGDRPVVGVSWHEAVAYCHWAGKRLPTEAEWEKAAHGTDSRTYPWGDNEPTDNLANFGKDSDKPIAEALAPVNSHESGKSPYGIYNMAGNVSEWVSDWYDEGFPIGDVWNPKGVESGKGKVLRGGGWFDAPQALQSSRRYYVSPEDRSMDRGFRCVQGQKK